MKSSLKTFLAGKNPYGQSKGEFATGLKDSEPYLDKGVNDFYIDKNGDAWYIDILDDDTAITYCKN